MPELQSFILGVLEVGGPIVVDILRVVLLALRFDVELTQGGSGGLLLGIEPWVEAFIQLLPGEGRAFLVLLDGLEADLAGLIALLGEQDGGGVVLAGADDRFFYFFEF
jgi:hypothetical protein